MGRIKEFDRLRNSREFTAVYNRSDKRWHTPWFVLFFKRGPQHTVGFVASKKVGNAVKRNRAKRRLRALFISYCDQIQSGSYILVAKPPMVDAPFDELDKAYRNALKKCRAFDENSQ